MTLANETGSGFRSLPPMELWQKLREMLSQELGMSPRDITDHTRFREDLSIDSITALNLMFRLERDFGVRITEEELVNLQTVGELWALLRRRLLDD